MTRLRDGLAEFMSAPILASAESLPGQSESHKLKILTPTPNHLASRFNASWRTLQDKAVPASSSMKPELRLSINVHVGFINEPVIKTNGGPKIINKCTYNKDKHPPPLPIFPEKNPKKRGRRGRRGRRGEIARQIQ